VRKIIKSLLLSMTMALVFALPVLAEGPPAISADVATVSQQITNLRELELPFRNNPSITLNGRIFDLTVELQIHKLKFESEATFSDIAKATMIPVIDNSTLTLKGRHFNSIALMASYGFISDDDAIDQLQALIMVQ